MSLGTKIFSITVKGQTYICQYELMFLFFVGVFCCCCYHKITTTSQFCPLKRSRSSDNLIIVNTSASQIVISEHHSSLTGTSFLEKWSIPGLGQKMYKLSQRQTCGGRKQGSYKRLTVLLRGHRSQLEGFTPT